MDPINYQPLASECSIHLLVFAVVVWHIACHSLSVDPPVQGGLLAWIALRLAWNLYAIAMTTAMG